MKLKNIGIIKKAEINLDELTVITGKMIEFYKMSNKDEDLHKHPLSKLIKDISQELNLI